MTGSGKPCLLVTAQLKLPKPITDNCANAICWILMRIFVINALLQALCNFVLHTFKVRQSLVILFSEFFTIHACYNSSFFVPTIRSLRSGALASIAVPSI